MPTPNHVHNFEAISSELRIALSDGGHTSVVVLSCTCGAFDVFPRSNYALTSQAFRDAVALVLARLGCYLVPEPTHGDT